MRINVKLETVGLAAALAALAYFDSKHDFIVTRTLLADRTPKEPEVVPVVPPPAPRGKIKFLLGRLGITKRH